LIHRVLSPHGDYTTNFQVISDICVEHCFIVKALNARFKRAKAAKLLVYWTLEELKNFLSNNSERNQKELFDEIANLDKPLNCKQSLEETKKRTIVTSEMDVKLAEICADKLEAKTELYQKLFTHA
jgi:hypothetical protein